MSIELIKVSRFFFLFFLFICSFCLFTDLQDSATSSRRSRSRFHRCSTSGHHCPPHMEVSEKSNEKIHGLLQNNYNRIPFILTNRVIIYSRCITALQDRREYARFEEEQRRTVYALDENPLFRPATTRFRVPSMIKED